MCRSLADVKWNNPTHAVTAFLIVIIIPLTYSIAYGLIAGIGCYGIMEGTFFLLSFVGISKPVYDEVPAVDEDETVSINKPDEDELLEEDGGRDSPDEPQDGEDAGKTGHEVEV